MTSEQNRVSRLYRNLLSLYPRAFKERLGESMEQTFEDLCNEKRQTKKELSSFILWTFIETAIGIFRERLLLISPGDIMQTIPKTLGSSAVISFLLILPFMIMEVINRRNFNEDFPILLFFIMWLNLFAVSLILLPIVRGGRIGNPAPTTRNSLITNPESALLISMVLILFPLILSWLDSLGWGPLERLLNGPNPEQLYVFRIRVPSQFIALVLFSLPVAAGIIAGGPIIHNLRAGGSLFAHPIHLIIVVVISSIFAIGFANFIIDQWPCFIGVPNCD